jgi:hypothetical protein
MIRLALIGGSVVLGLAAWLGAHDGVMHAPVVVAEVAVAQADTRVFAPGLEDTAETSDRLSDTMIGRCLEVALEVDPALAARLETIRRDRSEQDFRRAMSRARHLVSLARLKQENPQLYSVKVAELQLQAREDQLLNELIDARRASSPAIAELELELQSVVKAQVAYSLVARGMYLSRLERHVKSLRDELNHDLQPANFQPAVQRRYQGLLDQVDAALGE